MELELHRMYFPEGTNGIFLVDEKVICSSIELPYLDNKKQVSCIPEGTYPIKIVVHTRLGMCILVERVLNRNGILIHTANNAKSELKGCIAPVMKLAGIAKGVHSKKVLGALIQIVKLKEIKNLTIKKQENECNRKG